MQAPELTVHNPETYAGGERVFDSFYNGLLLVGAVERKYTAAVLGVEPGQFREIYKRLGLEEMQSVTRKLRTLYFGDSEHKDRYQKIVDKALHAQIENDPDKYSAFNNPELVELAQRLARTGLLCQIGSKQVEIARAKRHRQKLSGGQFVSASVRRAVKEASRADDLIKFNHLVRDTIESDIGRSMNLDREKTRQILRAVMPGDREVTDGIEDGVALEVATKRFLEQQVGGTGPRSVVYGDVAQDSKGGDLVLFGSQSHKTLIDLKKSAPNEVRKIRGDDELSAPGYFWKSDSQAYLWLGREGSVDNSYRLPPQFAETARRLATEAVTHSAIA